MPRPVSNDTEKYRLNRERYAVLTRLGADWREASQARSAERFAELVRARGRDPAEWPDLIKPSGRVAKQTTVAVERRERYRRLVDLGATSAEAGIACRGPWIFQRLERKLLAKRGEPSAG